MNALTQNSDYKRWLKDLRQKVAQTQIKAAVSVNATLLQFYWELGEDIVQRQAQASWGDGFLAQLSKDLMAEFPEMKGFSFSNLKYIRQWVVFYSQDQAIGQQLVDQLIQIPWGHNLKIIARCQSITEARYYLQKTLENGWSRSVLTHQIESGLWQREKLRANRQMVSLLVNASGNCATTCCAIMANPLNFKDRAEYFNHGSD